jgi:hypothetical protein
MNQKSISGLRTVNQQLTSSKFKSAREVAVWMGALQAQDYDMAKWALGIRMQNSTLESINREIDSGSIIRTHLLRPTWHFVSSDDLHWMLELTAPRIKSATKFREKHLGLTDHILSKCFGILVKVLRDGNHSTRQELVAELKMSGIDVGDNRASHIFLRAELEGMICSGRERMGKPTYALLEEWVPQKRKIKRDEALKELARRYFTSRGPASVNDFIWWSGISVKDSRVALDLNKADLISENIQDQVYWMANSFSAPENDNALIHFLPAYDEFLISYKDRTAALEMVNNKKTISNNGIFYPAVLQNGQIIGTWKRNIKNDQVIITRKLFRSAPHDDTKLLFSSAARYAAFIGKKLELNHNIK